MPNNKQVEVVDHREEAEQLLGHLGDPSHAGHVPDQPRDPLVAAAAQVHATLALVDEVRGLREAVVEVGQQINYLTEGRP